jgi:hypothetical protein
MEVRRIDNWPGACSRPLDLASVTLPRTGLPAGAIVFLSTTRFLASDPSKVCPAWAVPELSPELMRMVTGVPAGMFWATANAVASNRVAIVKILRNMTRPFANAGHRFVCSSRVESLRLTLQL